MRPVLLKAGKNVDPIVLTVIPRDLYRLHPGKFEVSVQTPVKAYWEHNPYIVHNFGMGDEVPDGLTVIEINDDGPRGQHVLLSAIRSASRQLGVDLALTEFKPCIWLTEEEMAYRPSPKSLLYDKQFWLVWGGYVQNRSAWTWDVRSWQFVVHQLAYDPEFPLIVQVGNTDPAFGEWNPLMRNCVEITTGLRTRDILKLVHASAGVLCGLSCYHHIAAALRRPAVVVAPAVAVETKHSYTEDTIDSFKREIPDKFKGYLERLSPQRYFVNWPECAGETGCGCYELNTPGNSMCKNALPKSNRADGNQVPQPFCMLDHSTVAVAESARKLHRECWLTESVSKD